ncbi:hypothetical protein KP79_PYT04632 [Mizuhopecten yessoensis]|uniref:Acyl-ACP thioesterase-like C-terminal domain-containing protein n=1 Tax=Mizuhopecten yessoensis TaxID=6573 RepID=A0A210PZJ1_MIZYE|nr:hypothetical protein KP79_PYT04632 [Mizuhopecten yessoensis]
MIVPRQVFSHKLQTRHSDLDSNGHVGTQEYFRFCMECAINASISGFYHHFVSNISLFPILKADITFRGQSVEGKELNILTWQCEHNPAKMYFVIMRDNVRITECSFIFWENKIASVLSKS